MSRQLPETVQGLKETNGFRKLQLDQGHVRKDKVRLCIEIYHTERKMCLPKSIRETVLRENQGYT